jgi:glutamate-ammonia-ligase adenylyltransferase
VSEGLGDSPWYLRSLRDESQTAQRLITILGTSRWLTELLLAAPESVAMLADDEGMRPRTRDELLAEMSAVVSRADDAANAVAQVRSIRRRELWRIGCADLLGLIEVPQVGDGLTALMQATLHAALAACVAENQSSEQPALAIIAMGRFGGGELGYGSDADVMFTHRVHDGQDEPSVNQSCIDIIGRLRALLHAPSPDPRVDLDADLRPEGRNGPLVRTVDSYAAYYAQWAKVWESQALLRAAFAAGDADAGAEWLAVIDPVRWPQGGIGAADVTEIRRLKARMESERLPRGVDPMSHLKLGPGGLSDVEWTVQLLQLQHAHRLESLRTTGTLSALAAAADAGLLTVADARDLALAWTFCTRVRNYQVLVSGRATDVMPADMAEAVALATALGYANAEELRQEHARVRRVARKVMERVFYDVAV